MPITFSAQDINLASFLQTNAMVVTVHIDKWDITRILIDNGSQVKVLLLSTFDKMGYNRKHLKEPTKPLYGFGNKRIEPVGMITLLVSFGTLENPRTKYITFDVIDMHDPHNTIFGSGLLNTFKTALHSGYLCLKVPNERLDPDLLRGRGKSIDGDLDVDEEGSEQNDQNLAITTPRLHWLPTCVHMSWPHQEG
jgi:hypothetical protein